MRKSMLYKMDPADENLHNITVLSELVDLVQHGNLSPKDSSCI